jgi:DNA polymerase-1
MSKADVAAAAALKIIESGGCRASLTGTICRLGVLGCGNVQLSGNSAANIKASQEAEQKVCEDLPALVPGQYDVMVIGDHPSFSDDKLDIPFQDNPSALIIDYLETAGHDLSRVYMTKLIKCSPPRKRKPAVSEINKCRDAYARREIELIQPKVVITIGTPSLRAFNLTGVGSINAIRGRVFEEKFAGWEDGPTFKVVPTLNPATFFFKPNEKLKARVGHDYVVAHQVANDLPVEPHFTPEWDLIDTPEKLEWLATEIEKTNLIAFDTESCLLNYRKVPLLSIQIAWGWDKTAVIPIHKHDPNAPKEQEFHVLDAFGKTNPRAIKTFLKRIFENPDISKVAHNFKYDYNVLRWHYDILTKGFLYDTWVQKHLMHEIPPSDLEFCCDLEFAWGDYSEERRKITGSGKQLQNSFDKVSDEILWPYGATDALGTYRLACVYTERLQREHPNLWQFYVDESEPLITTLAKAEYKGALMDPEVMGKLEVEWEGELAALLVKMRGMTQPDFNPMSNPQLMQAFHNLGVDIELQDESAASGYSANKKKLQELIETHKNKKVLNLAEWIMEYRNRRKMLSTYMKNARKDMDADGRLRYSWVQAGPVTGRLSCTFFHQIPKIDEARVKKGLPIMRDMFIVPDGSKYVYGDFSQIELFILSIISKDIEMFNMLNGGGDLHGATTFEFLAPVWPGYTEAMAKKDKYNRTEVGKRVNFGLAYGSEGHALVKTGKWKDKSGKERPFTWDMLNEGMKRWKSRFVGVKDWIDRTPDEVRFAGSIATNVFGRERHFGGQLTQHNDYERGAAEREAINFFIQSVAASITNRTLIEIDRMLEAFGISEDEICLINTVHDSVAYEVADYLAEWFLEAINIISSRVITELGSAFKIDLGVGDTWSDAEMAA